MKMLDIYDVTYIDYFEKDGIMRYTNTGVVESKKFFPIYGKNIFKPLSRSKPLTTPLFAYSEVFWSYFIKKYFVESAPRYYLAKCSNIENELPKYYSIGTLVEKVTSEKQKLVNLLDYFKEHPDPSVSIDGYTNYCNEIYDYTKILQAKIFQDREDLRHQLEVQILLSIMKRDENFHYENISFIVEDGDIISLCPPLDSEFSLPFLFPDNTMDRMGRIIAHKSSLDVPLGVYIDKDDEIEQKLTICLKTNLNNLIEIVKKDVDVVISFKEKLKDCIEEIENTDILFVNHDFVGSLSSDYWRIGWARYKDNDEAKARELEQSISLHPFDAVKFNHMLRFDCLEGMKELLFNLEIILLLYHNGSDLTFPTIKDVVDLKGLQINVSDLQYLPIDYKINTIFSDKIKEKVHE